MTSLPDSARVLNGERDVALRAVGAGAAPVGAQGVEIGEALLVALPPRGDAVAEPVLLVDDLAVELVALALLLFQHRVAPGLVCGEALVEAAGLAAVEPDGGVRQISRGSGDRG